MSRNIDRILNFVNRTSNWKFCHDIYIINCGLLGKNTEHSHNSVYIKIYIVEQIPLPHLNV